MLKFIVLLLIFGALALWRDSGPAWLQELPGWLMPALAALCAVLLLRRIIRSLRASIADMSD